MAVTRPGPARQRSHDELVLQLRVDLEASEPSPWRVVLISERAALLELHRVVQALFGREESEQHSFLVDGIVFEAPLDGSDSPRDTDGTTLRQLELEQGNELVHQVESDGLIPWRHLLTVEDRFQRPLGQRLPLCVEGAGASPPEDVGSPEDWQQILAAVGAPIDARTATLMEWLPPEFDPAFFDRISTNARLARLPRRGRDPDF